MNRPLVWAALSFAAGLYAGHREWCPGAIFPVLILAVAVLVLLLPGRYAHRQAIGLCLALFGVGALYWNGWHAGPPGDALHEYALKRETQDWKVEGNVRRARLWIEGDDYTDFVLDVDRVRAGRTARPLRGRVLVRWSHPGFRVHPGQRVAVAGHPDVILGPVNFGFRSREDTLRSQSVFTALKAYGPGVRVVGEGRFSPARWASRLRAWEADVFRRTVPADSLDFVLAVWLGARGRMDGPLYEWFSFSGTAHILAVSGIHVAIIYVSCRFLLGLLLVPGRWRAAATMLAVFIFAMAAGARAPTLRAAAMVAVYLAAELFDREPDAPTALSIAGLALLLANPNGLVDPSYLLSFVSVSSIMLFGNRLLSAAQGLPWLIRGSVATTLSVQILPLPIAAHYFRVLPLAAPLANLVVVPLLGVVLWLCFATVVCAAVAPPVAVLFGHAIAPVFHAIRGVAYAVASTPGSYLAMLSPTQAGALLYWLAAAAFGVLLERMRMAQVHSATGATPPRVAWWRLGRWRTDLLAGWRDASDHIQGFVASLLPSRLASEPLAARPYLAWENPGVAFWLLCTLLLLSGAALFWAPLRPPPSVDFLDVARADAIFVRTPGGTTMLIDGGRSNEYIRDGKWVVVPFLRAQGVRHLDYVVNTHPHNDHLGGLLHVLRRVSVGTVLLPHHATDAILEREFLRLCEARDVPVVRVGTGDEILAAGARFEVLHPPADWKSDDENESSLVLRLVWDGPSVLFTGDIEADAEALLAARDCAADALKTPHHGSATSSSAAFLEAVDPQSAVVSTKPPGRRPGIDPSVQATYERLGIPLWRTDYHGGVRLWRDRGEWRFTGARLDRGYSLAPPGPNQ